jgi:hypothetical protein
MTRKLMIALAAIGLVCAPLGNTAWAHGKKNATAASHLAEAVEALTASSPDPMEATSQLEMAIGAKDKNGVKINFLQDALQFLQQGKEKEALDLLRKATSP